MKCLFFLAATLFLVYVSAEHDKEKDSRPMCVRDKTEKEEKEARAVLKTCKKGLTEDQKKDKKSKIQNIESCIMKAKNLVNENGEIVQATFEADIEKYGTKEFKQDLKDLVTKCIATKKVEDYVKCFKKNQKDLPCRFPRQNNHSHHHDHHHRKGNKKGEEE